jgi:H+/Cl- antiporter ClcA
MRDIFARASTPSLKKSYLVLLLFSIGLGGGIGAIAGSFMYAQHYLIVFLWESIPQQLGETTALYFFFLCVFGGLVVGLGRKHLGDHPQAMQTIMAKVKTGKDLPGIATVPIGYLLSLLSLGFGAALGPEAALVGITVGFGSWARDIMAKFGRRLQLQHLQKPWSRLPGFSAIFAGFVVFALVSKPMFNTRYPFVPYQFSLSGSEILLAVLLGFVGLILGVFFAKAGVILDKLLHPLQNRPVIIGMVGGIILGALGAISPLILFSGQTGLGRLFVEGAGLNGFFLILIGLLKMIATKSNTVSGWKGGEIFPVMFASAAIALGISHLLPAIHPMIAIAAIMAATVTVVLDNIFLALAIMAIFLPWNLFLSMTLASLVAILATKKIAFGQRLIAVRIPINHSDQE